MTESITVVVPNKLSVADAKRRIESGFDKLARNIGGAAQVDQNWADNRMQFSAAAAGHMIRGTLDVREETVRIDVELPWLLAKLAKPIKDKLTRDTTRLQENK